MNIGERHKEILLDFVRVVWDGRDISALPNFWTNDCMNHSSPEPDNVGLNAIRAYHEGFIAGFLPAFSNSKIGYVQQVAEDDRAVSQMMFTGNHTGSLFGALPIGKIVSLSSIRIDRFSNGKIAEHWSVAVMAGFMQQLQER